MVEKSKNRLSHHAWKSRKVRGIPTFPPPRRLLEINETGHFTCYQKRTSSLAKNTASVWDAEVALLHSFRQEVHQPAIYFVGVRPSMWSRVRIPTPRRYLDEGSLALCRVRADKQHKALNLNKGLDFLQDRFGNAHAYLEGEMEPHVGRPSLRKPSKVKSSSRQDSR